MNVVIYTRPSYLDSALPLIFSLSRKVKMHVIMEVSPESRHGGGFKLPVADYPAGLVPLKDIPEWLPPCLQSKLQDLASFHLAVYTTPRSFSFGSLRTCWQVSRYIRANKPEVVHFDEASNRAFLLPYLMPNVPLVMSIHDSRQHIGELAKRFVVTQKSFLNRSCAVIFHSEFARKSFSNGLDRCLPDTYVIPLGIFDTFRAFCDGNIASKERMILFFGRISPYKGLEVLLSAVSLAAQRVANIKLVIAGRPIQGYNPSIPGQFVNGGVCECLLHHISPEELCRLFNAAEFVVAPYIEVTQSGVISTAYAFYKPVVATTVGGLPELVEDGVTGKLVPPDDPGSLAKAMVDLLLDSELRSQMTENIRRKEVDDLSWDRLSEMTLNVYRQAIKNN